MNNLIKQVFTVSAAAFISTGCLLIFILYSVYQLLISDMMTGTFQEKVLATVFIAMFIMIIIIGLDMMKGTLKLCKEMYTKEKIKNETRR